MASQPQPDPLALARSIRSYQPGDQVKILRGRLAGKVMTVYRQTHDWVMLEELPPRDAMSKLNVEPAAGFTADEMAQADQTIKAMDKIR